MPVEGLFQALQKLATMFHRLDELTEDLDDIRISMGARLEKLDGQVADLRERVARLEASRDADRAQLQAELARFKAEVERAKLLLTKESPPHRELSE